MANADSFGWKLDGAGREGSCSFLDAQPSPDLVQSGTSISAACWRRLRAQMQAMGARRIVFDALDIVLALLPDAAARQREIYRLARLAAGA